MLKKIRERMQDEKGFTLIELMVVVLIIAILLAIAIPTFLRVRSNAQDRAAQSSVGTALKAEKAYYTEGNEEYIDDVAELEEVEASIGYFSGTASTADCATGFAAGPSCVQVTLISSDEVLLVAQAANDTFWAARDRAIGPVAGTFYNEGGSAAAPTAANAATEVNDPAW